MCIILTVASWLWPVHFRWTSPHDSAQQHLMLHFPLRVLYMIPVVTSKSTVANCNYQIRHIWPYYISVCSKLQIVSKNKASCVGVLHCHTCHLTTVWSICFVCRQFVGKSDFNAAIVPINFQFEARGPNNSIIKIFSSSLIIKEILVHISSKLPEKNCMHDAKGHWKKLAQNHFGPYSWWFKFCGQS